MFYFIPAWYNANRKWYDITPLWFRTFERMSFDDTVNQMKLFHNSNEPAALLLLNYQPQLRYFLHKQDLLSAKYWSFFDDIQNITKTTVSPIFFKQLEWPDGVEFIYSPFAIVVRVGKEIIAYINFAENGNLLYVDYHKNNRISEQHVYDDRGFLSSVLYFDTNGATIYQDYLNEQGVWQVREHLSTNRKGIEINPNADKMFQKYFYNDWEELMQERLRVLQQEIIQANDTLVVASHAQHNLLIMNEFDKQNKVFSFFQNRYDLDPSEELLRMGQESKLLVVDTEKQENNLYEALHALGVHSKVSRIVPFDTRLRLGRSQTIKELIIYFYVDTITQEQLKEYLYVLFEHMATNELITLKLVTFDQRYPIDTVQKWIENTLQKEYALDLFFTMESQEDENQLAEDMTMELSRVQFERFTNENQVIAALDTARLVFDFGENPDLYTQIASISAGVPQINTVATDYVVHQKNGWLIQEPADLNEVIPYYFETLTNWNKALVYAVEKMGDYTSGRILRYWMQQLEEDDA